MNPRSSDSPRSRNPVYIGIDPDAGGGYLAAIVDFPCVGGGPWTFFDRTIFPIDRETGAFFVPVPALDDGGIDRLGVVELVGDLDARLLLGDRGVVVALEVQQAFPGKGPKCPRCGKPKFQQGLASTAANVAAYECWATAWTFALYEPRGSQHGFVEPDGPREKLARRLLLPRPAEWKGPLGLTSDKDLSIAKARELAPEVDFRPTERNPRSRAPSHGKAEALLLAFHARRVASREKAKK